MRDRSVVLYRTALAGLMVGFFALPAYAGFEWTPPSAAPQAAASEPGPDILPAPTGKVEMMELMPIPSMAEPEPVAQAQVTPIETLPPPARAVEAAVIEEETPAPAVKPLSSTLQAPTLQGRFAETQGFGSDIPLALAMGQIVPAEYAYSFASNVNPGLKVSWNGGKPWNEVLNEALQPLGLRADVAGSAVIVRTLSAAPLSVPEVSYKDTERHSEVAPPPAVIQQAALRGEGTAENYPRRTREKKTFLSSIKETFISESEPAADAGAPPPPDMDRQVIVENTAMSSGRDVDAAVTEQVRNYEPAAPGATLAELAAAADREAARELELKNSPLVKQKVSYAEGGRVDSDSIFPERTVSRRDENSATATGFNPGRVSLWQADSKQDLREVLTTWSQTAGVEMIWDSGYNYKLPVDFTMQGTFQEAVDKIFALYGATEPRPKGRVHPNLPKGPSVLVVENYP